jgi:RNA ligase (TIGR02306 family)
MGRKLASVQRISSIEPIENADAIERINILGWVCVARKGEFRVGDLCVYFEIDSMLPERPEFEFMRARSWRVRTIRLRGQIAQGLALPTKDINLNISYLQEGDDVTKHLGVKKYLRPGEREVRARLFANAKGILPGFVKKTDEFRIQSYPRLLEDMSGMEVYQTVKLDGSSMTVYFNNKIEEPFGVCSRNLNLKEDDQNSFWKVANNYGLREKLTELGVNCYIQGELCGPGVQKNRLELNDLDVFIFNVFFLDEGRYAGMDELVSFCNHLGLKTVPTEDTYTFGLSLEQVLERAKGKYEGTKNHREGIVVRPVKAILSPRLGYALTSFKAINNDYLLKNEE